MRDGPGPHSPRLPPPLNACRETEEARGRAVLESVQQAKRERRERVEAAAAAYSHLLDPEGAPACGGGACASCRFPAGLLGVLQAQKQRHGIGHSACCLPREPVPGRQLQQMHGCLWPTAPIPIWHLPAPHAAASSRAAAGPPTPSELASLGSAQTTLAMPGPHS